MYVTTWSAYVTILQQLPPPHSAGRNDPERRIFRPGGRRGTRPPIGACAFQSGERGLMAAMAAIRQGVGINEFAGEPESERTIETMAFEESDMQGKKIARGLLTLALVATLTLWLDACKPLRQDFLNFLAATRRQRRPRRRRKASARPKVTTLRAWCRPSACVPIAC